MYSVFHTMIAFTTSPSAWSCSSYPLTVALPQFAALVIKHHPRQPMPPLAAVVLGQNPLAICLIVQVVQQEQRLYHRPELLQGADKLGLLRATLERAQQRIDVVGSDLQRVGNT